MEVFTEDAISILLSCLKDSYEHNKMVAFDLLMAVPPQCLPFQVCSNLISNRLIGDSLITTAKFVPCCICTVSIRPAHAVIGQKPMFYQSVKQKKHVLSFFASLSLYHKSNAVA